MGRTRSSYDREATRFASGGFGSAARIALACDHGADTINVSFDAPPNPESKNKIRKIGSPAWHRNAAIEQQLRARGRAAVSFTCDAFDPVARDRHVEQSAFLFAISHNLEVVLQSRKRLGPHRLRISKQAIVSQGGMRSEKC